MNAAPKREIEVSFAYRQHVGGRFVAAGVTLDFHPSITYTFRSTAIWPSENYDTEVESAVKDVLIKLGIENCTFVTLKSISWDASASSSNAFTTAARLATQSAFG